jgi:hypothetical protein
VSCFFSNAGSLGAETLVAGLYPHCQELLIGEG